MPTIIQTMAHQWVIIGIPYAPHQLQACEAAFIRLIEESHLQQALAILNSLQQQALQKANPWDWVTAELLFEAYAIALDNRFEAASHYLRFSLNVSDETLDVYNERISRFTNSYAPYTHAQPKSGSSSKR